MGSVKRLFQYTAFDSDTTRALGEAFDRAWELHDTGDAEAIGVRETIAKTIIKAAKDGEFDPERLCEWALYALTSPADLQHRNESAPSAPNHASFRVK